MISFTIKIKFYFLILGAGLLDSQQQSGVSSLGNVDHLDVQKNEQLTDLSSKSQQVRKDNNSVFIRVLSL